MGICNTREKLEIESGKRQDTRHFSIKIFNCVISVNRENIANIQVTGIVLPMRIGISFEENIYKIPDIRSGPLLALIQKGMAESDNSNQYIKILRADARVVAKQILCYEIPEVTQHDYKGVLSRLIKEILNECKRNNIQSIAIPQ